MFGTIAEEIIGKATDVIMNEGVKVGETVAKAAIQKIKNKDSEKELRERAENEKNPPAVKELTDSTPHGIFFGMKSDKYIIKPENRSGHVLVIGGSGSGKSRCVAMPTIRYWKNGIFAIDVKGELYTEPGQHRNKIKVFAPYLGRDSPYGYDPYYSLKKTTDYGIPEEYREADYQEVKAIVDCILPLSHEVRNPIWIGSARTILEGAIFHFLKEEKSFVETIKAVLNQSFQELMDEIIFGSSKKARLCVSSLGGMADETSASVYMHLVDALKPLVLDDKLSEALSKESKEDIITPEDLENGYDVFVEIPEKFLSSYHSFLTLMVNQFIKFFEKRDETTAKPILMLLDEFPRLGKMPAITDALATLRSKNVHICLIAQSLKQLEDIYGQNTRGVIADNCSLKAVLRATDPDTQKYFSELAGKYKEMNTTISTDKEPILESTTRTGTSTAPHRDFIIQPHEFAILENHIVLIHDIPNECKKTFFRVKKMYYPTQHRTTV